MKKIERFNITVSPKQTIKVPFNSEILSFSVLNGEPGFTAIVDPGQKIDDRTLFITTVGKDLPEMTNRHKFIGEFQLRDRKKKGSHNVFLVFEE